jgi:hypothetical protein
MATTVVTVDGSFYVLSTAVWDRIYAEFLRCIKSCNGPKEQCVQGCKERLGWPDGSLRPGVTLGQVDWCFSVCEDNYNACLARCNAKYQEDVLDNAIRVEPGAPPPYADEVLAFKTPAGKRTLRELGLKMAVRGGIVSGAGLVLRTVLRASPVAGAIGTATAVAGIVNGVTGLLMKVIADDPPDPLYRTMWTPRTGVLTALSDFMSELDPVVVPLLEPIRNEASISIYAEAVAVSLERAAAATAAGHPDIARSHLVAGFDYANVCASSLSRAKSFSPLVAQSRRRALGGHSIRS